MLTPLKRSLIWRWRKGFKPTSKVFFDTAHDARGDYTNYMPDASFRSLAATNGIAGRTLLNDKFLFEQVVGKHVRVPSTLAIVERGTFTALDPDSVIDNLEALLRYVQVQAVALKPAQGAKGQGVYSLSGHDELRLDGVPVQGSRVAKLLEHLDYYLVVPWVQQADYAASVFAEASNTLRLITMRDPSDRHRPFIMAAVQKFGTRVSAPTDNWSRGALFAPVDLTTGVVGAGLADLAKTQGKPVWHEQHPDSGAPIKGVKVPGWSVLTSAVLDMLEALPLLTYVGWDVLVTQDGFYVIEGNPAPVVVSLQLTRPALTDARVRQFAEHHHVLGKW